MMLPLCGGWEGHFVREMKAPRLGLALCVCRRSDFSVCSYCGQADWPAGTRVTAMDRFLHLYNSLLVVHGSFYLTFYVKSSIHFSLTCLRMSEVDNRF